MGSLSRLIKEKGGQFEGVKTEQVRVQQIHYTKLKESQMNFYTRNEEEVEELADTMIIAGGILQPLIVRKTDLSEYEILAGHKRRRASMYNVERGYKEYEFLPCIVMDMSGLMAKKVAEKVLAEHDSINDDELLDMIAEYIVIFTNSTASERSDYEKMMQAVRLSEILPVMLDNENLKGRALRAEIAKEMMCSDGQVGRYQSIYNNLVPEAMERFKTGEMVISTAAEMSGLDRDRQREVLKKGRITLEDIRLLKQQEKTVSESDTENVFGEEIRRQEENSETVSESDTEKVFGETFDQQEKTVSESDTENVFDEEIWQQEENSETVSESDTENVFDEEIWQQEENSETVSESDTENTSLAAAPDEDTFKTAASREEEHVQTFHVEYTQEDIEEIYKEQTELVQQFENVMACGGMTAADQKRYKKALIIRDGISYMLKIFEKEGLC